MVQLKDPSRVKSGRADHNLGLVRRLALNLLKQESTARVGIKVKRKKAGWDHDYLLKVLPRKTRLPWRPLTLPRPVCGTAANHSAGSRISTPYWAG